MRNPNRLYSFYNELQTVHITYFPDLRFCQLIEDFFTWLKDTKNVDVYYTEEYTLIKYLKEFVETCKKQKFL